LEGSTFEEKLGRVKDITDQIESGKLPLEEAVRKFELGIQVLNELDAELNEMKRRISLLRGGKEIPAGDAAVEGSDEE